MAGKMGRRGWGWIRRLPSSKRYQASYVGPDLGRHYAPGTFHTRMDAERWLGDERRLIDQDIWTSPTQPAARRKADSITLNEYADKWIEHRNVKPGTKIEYKRLKARLIADTLGKAPLKNITTDAVRGWYSSLGNDTPRRNSHAYGLLHAIMSTAVADQLIPANPCMIPRAMNTARKREPVILSVIELAKVADAIKPERLRCFVLVSAWCGLRWGEAIELRRRDIDDTCEVIMVSRAVTHRGSLKPGSPGCRIDTPKSGKGTGGCRAASYPRRPEAPSRGLRAQTP